MPLSEFDRFRYHSGNMPGIAAEYAGFFPQIFRRFAQRRAGNRITGYIGWTGYRNLGDEAMFEAVRRLLPAMELSRFAGPRRESALAKFGLGGSSLFRAIVLGGGTLINPAYVRLMSRAMRFSVPLYTFGTGVGSCGFSASPVASLAGWNSLLRSCRRVAVRGPVSRDALECIGIDRVTVIGDPALSLSPDQAPARRTRRRLVINLTQDGIHDYAEGNFAIFRRIEKIAKEFVRDGGEVVGVALGCGDLGVLRKFRDHAGMPEMQIAVHRTDFEDFFSTVQGSIGLIGVRLHSAVLASCIGVPSALISYRNKCYDFMQSMNMPEFAIPFSPGSGDQLECAWRRIVEDPEQGARVWKMARRWKQRQIEYAAEITRDLETGHAAAKAMAAGARQ